ncbi:hypothetical protein HELRODRAFT_158391 [Helobdella robusta]|uniref:Uncharacterized protein n=1 Tax=Helobdella robusta TaxID=6412 RepID=T1EMR1_HELRO|nr:hypothetical protein HELRODRAFT_158391 [Helobdella robusta]ESO12003.1 hypothetical protein HELRODRAFT_158391 [Helobdella robusta]
MTASNDIMKLSWCFGDVKKFYSTVPVFDIHHLKPRGHKIYERYCAFFKTEAVKVFCHIMRKERMENLTTTRKITWKKDRGQQRITFVLFLCYSLNITTFQFIQSVKDRVLWRSMVAKS